VKDVLPEAMYPWGCPCMTDIVRTRNTHICGYNHDLFSNVRFFVFFERFLVKKLGFGVLMKQHT